MISVDSVYTKLDVLISKAQSLQSTLGATGGDGHNADLEARSAHTYYGLPEALGEDIEKSISAIMVAEQKVLALY